MLRGTGIPVRAGASTDMRPTRNKIEEYREYYRKEVHLSGELWSGCSWELRRTGMARSDHSSAIDSKMPVSLHLQLERHQG